MEENQKDIGAVHSRFSPDVSSENTRILHIELDDTQWNQENN
jgi:hypothetical protein